MPLSLCKAVNAVLLWSNYFIVLSVESGWCWWGALWCSYIQKSLKTFKPKRYLTILAQSKHYCHWDYVFQSVICGLFLFFLLVASFNVSVSYTNLHTIVTWNNMATENAVGDNCFCKEIANVGLIMSCKPWAVLTAKRGRNFTLTA